jgi:hypothetical protein
LEALCRIRDKVASAAKPFLGGLKVFQDGFGLTIGYAIAAFSLGLVHGGISTAD